jgi:glutathione S-transferase
MAERGVTSDARIFLAEKSLAVPTVQVDLRNGEQFTPAFRALNPNCMVPVLELDSGAAITDIIAICRYFEELHPDPRLMGRSAEERAVIESWLRRIEWDGIYVAQARSNMEAAGIDPKQVDIVLISHFHGDHIGGLKNADGSAAFPNAEIKVPAIEAAFWADDGNQSKANGFWLS